MKRLKHSILLCLLGLFTGQFLLGQDKLVLEFDTFIELVKTHHPLSLGANLVPEQGVLKVQEARGAFDPKLQSDLSAKQFDDKTYYQNFEGGVKIPTTWGLEFNTGFEQNDGIYLNPEQTVPEGGLVFAGLSFPLGRGMFIDERRAALKQAKVYQEMSLSERRTLLNELFFEAGKAYWEWFKAYEVLKVYEEAQRLTELRLDGVKQAASLGDRALIDTLEATIQVQNRTLNTQEASLDLDNARLKLEFFLWKDGRFPLELEIGTVPVEGDSVAPLQKASILASKVDSLAMSHPDLVVTRLKLEQLAIEQRLKREQLKPQLDVKYNFLTEPVGGDWATQFTTNNYALGLNFSFPILLRKARAGVQMNQLKMAAQQFKIENKEASIQNKAQMAMNKVFNSYEQTVLAADRVEGYARLLEAERQMFNAGESSLFLVNSRESSFVQAQVKFLEILVKNRKAEWESQYTLGVAGTYTD